MENIKTLYIEITSHCNLSCVMCSRNHWVDETIGDMSIELFDKVLLETPNSVEKIFLGGIGEPMVHPNIFEIIRKIKASGRSCELITNGTLLDKACVDELIDAKVDVVWVSIDSMDESTYEKIRVGANYHSVLENLRYFKDAREKKLNFNPYAYTQRLNIKNATTKLGISFVMMKSNLNELERIINNTATFGINFIKVTHLLPYNKEMADEICYERVLAVEMHTDSNKYKIEVDMPVMDTYGLDLGRLPEIFTRGAVNFSFMGEKLRRKEGYCRFVQEGVTFVRWDGEVCPCMALLHTNTTYQQKTQRTTRFCSYGNVKEKSLLDIWNDKDYKTFRQRVIDFDFSPCTKCGACDLFEKNEEDCFNSPFPTCGPCLWAQGLIQCP